MTVHIKVSFARLSILLSAVIAEILRRLESYPKKPTLKKGFSNPHLFLKYVSSYFLRIQLNSHLKLARALYWKHRAILESLELPESNSVAARKALAARLKIFYSEIERLTPMLEVYQKDRKICKEKDEYEGLGYQIPPHILDITQRLARLVEDFGQDLPRKEGSDDNSGIFDARSFG